LRTRIKVRRGQPLSIRGKGYQYEGEFFWDYWYFRGRINGDLRVDYGDEGGVGFDGKLADAMIAGCCGFVLAASIHLARPGLLKWPDLPLRE